MTDTAQELSKIYAPLDPGIKDAVDFLRGKGINTTGSCDGKHDGGKDQPWISVDSRGEDLVLVRLEIAKLLLSAGYHGFTVKEEYLYQKRPEVWMTNLVIVFWGEAKPE